MNKVVNVKFGDSVRYQYHVNYNDEVHSIKNEVPAEIVVNFHKTEIH